MKNILDTLNKDIDRTRVLGIDPSSTSLAFTLIEDGRPSIWGKVTYFRKSDLVDKMRMMHFILPCILSVTGDPTYVVIEQMISVQNPQTTRILSYMAGAIVHEFGIRNIDILDCPPMTWKSFHGYKRVMKSMGLNKKEADHMRKIQIKDAIDRVYPWFDSNDFDVCDSCGIALWGAQISLKEVE